MSCCPTNRSALPCDYTPKGSIGAHHSYVVSSESPVRGLIVITDIFGLSEQAKYVADQLAERLNARIIMPDCFDGTTSSNSSEDIAHLTIDACL
mgnify:CR=1 FL=1